MARYLSPAWFEEVNAAAPAGGAAGGATVTLQQVVTGGPDGDVRYWVRVGPGGAVEAGAGDAGRADATVIQSWDTVAGLVAGDLDVEAALVAGRIRFSGNVALLLEHQSALLGVAGSLAGVRGRTTFG